MELPVGLGVGSIVGEAQGAVCDSRPTPVPCGEGGKMSLVLLPSPQQAGIQMVLRREVQ